DAAWVDLPRAGELSAREEEPVDAALAGAVDQLTPAIGEEALPAAAQQRDLRPAVAALARQQRRRGRDGRGRADRHVTGIADQAGNDAAKQLLVTESARSVTRRAGHARAGRDRRQILRRSQPCAHTRRGAPRPRRSGRQARAAKRLSAPPRSLARRSRRARRPRARDRRTGFPRKAAPPSPPSSPPHAPWWRARDR